MNIVRKIYYIFVDFLETIGIAAAIFVIVYAFLFRPFQVNGESMDPTFLNGEYVLTNLITLRIGELEHGDVVVFNAPVDDEKDFIKRIIGVPGDTVMINDGFVYLNGERLDESEYLPSDFRTYGGTFLAEGESVTVPPGNFFVMGDNRDFSSDSRQWGFVPKGNVIGKSQVVYWPVGRFRIVQHTDYAL